MNNTIQLYADKEKKVKAYPITSPDRVVDENGVSIKKHLRNNVKFDVVSEGDDVPEIDGKYDDTELREKIRNINEELDNIETKIGQPITLNRCDAEMINAIQNKEGETTFNLLSVPRDESVSYRKLDHNLSSVFEPTFTNVPCSWTTGGWYHKDTGLQNDDGWVYKAFEVKEGETYRITGYVLGNSRLFILADNDKEYIVDSMYPPKSEFIQSATLYENVLVNIPIGCKYILLSSTNNRKEYLKLEILKGIKLNGTDEMKNELTTKIENVHSELQKVIFKDFNYEFSETFGYYSRTGFSPDNNFRNTSIEVKEGEMYKLSGYVLGNTRLYVLADENKKYLNDLMFPLKTEFINPAQVYQDIEVVIPKGCKYLLYSTKVNNQSNSIKKGEKTSVIGEIEKNIEDVQSTTSDITNINKTLVVENELLKSRIKNLQMSNDFSWRKFDKIYVTFTFDDSNSDISDIEKLFARKGVPVCFASIPSKLDNTCTDGSKVRDVLKRCETNGGEILSHWNSPLTSNSTDEDYHNVYIKSKIELVQAGFNVNGIITSGGSNYNTQNFEKCVDIARLYYDYGDRTAEPKSLNHIEQYWNPRYFMNGDLTRCKTKINEVRIIGYGWVNFASHGSLDRDTVELIESVIDYIKSFPDTQIVTWNYLYNNFKSTKLEKRLLAIETK